MASKYQQHVANWQNCQRCGLHKYRKRVVLIRGTVPAPILFVGEAPGDSEDSLGSPFVGPAGHLMDHMIVNAGLRAKQYALTNIIACIPKDETNRKMLAPPEWAAEACRDRLVECFKLVKPKLVIWVGKEAASYGPLALEQWDELVLQAGIMHPAAIIRMHISQQGLAQQRNIIAISDAVEQVL